MRHLFGIVKLIVVVGDKPTEDAGHYANNDKESGPEGPTEETLLATATIIREILQVVIPLGHVLADCQFVLRSEDLR